MSVGAGVAATEAGITAVTEAAANAAPVAATSVETATASVAPAAQGVVETVGPVVSQSTETASSVGSAGQVLENTTSASAQGSEIAPQTETGAQPLQASVSEAPAEALTSDENLPIEDRLSNAVGNRVSEENKLKELEASGADRDTLHAQERKVWEARTHEGDLSHQRDASQMEQRLTEQVKLITKTFEAREISFNEKIDNLTRALQERDKLLEQVIGTIKDENKKHILLEALKLLGLALVGGGMEVASETKDAAVETTGAKA